MVYTINNEQLTRRKLVTIDGSKVTTETAIPLGLNINLHGVKAAGADVRLAKLDGTPIAREIECKDVPNTDDVMIWYQWDTTSGQNDQFMVYWGNPNLTEPAADSTYGSQAVWNSGYKCIHHMNNLTDSTANSHTLTAYNSPSIVDMAYGKGYDLDGSTQYFTMADSADWDFGTGEMSVEAYADIDVVQTTELIGWGPGSSRNLLLRVQDSGGYKILRYIHVDSTFQYGDTVVTTGRNQIGVSRVSGDWMVYLNGAEDDASWATDDPNLQSAEIVSVGRYSGGLHYLNGRYGELRISNVGRSTNYILTTHNNLDNPTSIGTAPFYSSFGLEQHQRRVSQFIN